MRYMIAVLLLTVACASPTPTPVPTLAPTPTIAPTATLAWYAGGTLQTATVAQWRAGSEADQLATAADWATGGFVIETAAGLEEMAPKLLACVNDGLEGYAAQYGEDAPMLDLAVVCVAGLR